MIRNATYQGERRNWTFESYYHAHQEAHYDLELYGEVVTENKKVTDFLRGILDPTCNVSKGITSPRGIAQEVCKMNTAQYHQAHDTPFGSGPLADMIGQRGDTPCCHELLCGTLPPEMPPSLLPETLRVLNVLAQPVPQNTGPPIITPDEFVSYILSGI